MPDLSGHTRTRRHVNKLYLNCRAGTTRKMATLIRPIFQLVLLDLFKAKEITKPVLLLCTSYSLHPVFRKRLQDTRISRALDTESKNKNKNKTKKFRKVFEKGARTLNYIES